MNMNQLSYQEALTLRTPAYGSNFVSHLELDCTADEELVRKRKPHQCRVFIATRSPSMLNKDIRC
jgi:hypothetical protein